MASGQLSLACVLVGRVPSGLRVALPHIAQHGTRCPADDIYQAPAQPSVVHVYFVGVTALP